MVVVIRCVDSVPVLWSGVWPYASVVRVVIPSPLYCVCGDSVHISCSGVMGTLSITIYFTDSACSGNQMMEPRVESINIQSLQCIDKFCYLKDMTGTRHAAEALVREPQGINFFTNNERDFLGHEN